MTLLERMADLHRQATVERSHHYVGSTLMDAADRIMALEAELKAAYDHAVTMEAENATLCKTLADADARIRDLKIFGDTVLATKNAEIERLTKLVEELKTIAAKPAPGGEGEK